MPLHWIYPDNFQIELYRSGWKNDRSFDRIVADIGGGNFPSVSDPIEGGFTIKANTLNKVRGQDVSPLIVPSTGSSIGPDTELQGIQREGYTFIRVEPTEVAREIESLKLLIRLAEEKITALKLTASRLGEGSEEAAEDLMDEINDIEMAVDDLQVYLERLRNIPRTDSKAR
ncbi:MAG: hypothetical protein WCI11_09530 [Candidatus Methylumidiphilus sp.]